MTKLAAALHALLLLAAVGSLAACGRTPIGDLPGAGGASNGCSTNADCPAGEQCNTNTHTCVPTPGGCKSDADCGAPTPHCRLDTHTCVECTTNSQCPSGEECSNFQCVGFCGNGQACQNGLTCCSPLCVDTGTNVSDCGTCGDACGPYPNAIPDCASGTCALGGCVIGFADCDGKVSDGCEVSTGSDPKNCGACGNVCPAGEACSGGVCVGPCSPAGCPSGETCCGVLCANTKADPNNCGFCGNFCPSMVPDGTAGCLSASCQITSCFPGFADCDGIVNDGCEADINTDPGNCGTCGNVCPGGGSCVNGFCQGPPCSQTGCPGGDLCCNAGTLCVNPNNDTNNCGACGVVCPSGWTCNGGACCMMTSGGGECMSGGCANGLTNCSNNCVDLNNDPNNCGFCGLVCSFGASCVNGLCTGSCNGGPACTGSDQICGTGCADLSSDPSNCGFCDNVCPFGGGCVNFSCVLDCNGGPACIGNESCCMTGCSDTTSDPNNCGFCGNACPLGEKCQNSSCFGGGCNGGPGCAPGSQCCMTGCSDTSSDSNNCGFCGNVCPTGENCANGMCTATCNGGPVCTSGQSCCPTGCTSTLSDPDNCGTCGNACGPGSNCVNGSCTATCNGGPACTGSAQCCPTGCSDTTSDPKNCGGCGLPCAPADSCVNGKCVAPTMCNGGPACAPSQTCCSTGCTDLNSDPNHCGTCGNACGATSACVGGNCASSEGAFNPTVSPTYLPAGPHSFTGINIPAGVVVYVTGSGPLSGTLDLTSSGPVVINGTIDLSGGPGGRDETTSQSSQQGTAGGGGYTGEPYASAPASSSCQWIAGNPGLNGFAIAGTSGNCTVLSTTVCVTQQDPTSLLFTAPVAQYGGGAGVFTGYRAYGSGGGGPAGGAPGALCAAYPGEQDCSGVSGGGGAVNGQGGSAGLSVYNGIAGASGSTQCPGLMPPIPPACVGGGGGGSIGVAAANDLGVLSTFQTGSAGGGGSADYLNRPVFGGTSGGGGGGGALRISSPVSITLGAKGKLLANGGIGGDADRGTGSNAGCDPQPGAAGGGGSGGVIYLATPSFSVAAGGLVSAAGGLGGAQSEYATGGGGGKGGLGRIRLSITPASCTVAGTFNPPLASGCTPAAKAGNAYVATYPN